MSSIVTTQQAAQSLSVHPSRVRALIASGALSATRAGRQWLIDAESLDRHADLVAAGATGRSFAPRIAWAAAALCDGLNDGLAAADRYRLRNRLAHAGDRDADTCALVRRWLSRRAESVHRYRVGERDLTRVLAVDGVLATGISTTSEYRLGLSTGGAADAYVNAKTHRELVEEFVLIESARGNLTLRVTDNALSGNAVAPRLIAGADLADDSEVRTRAAGCILIKDSLDEFRKG
ncbi:helix-turn-helix domain-containing protein [[Mycobacterium] vasticus]|uniref:Helix-turn-helix domain-containing protein n=1 Tax=[Mycobacterium] vasticus TaxID=2875777 RepID=A0ABU5YWP8_9MYCO|nr:helix-turn-helix domain-containing protein [Mycolicibacter sp. MYC017]MEB3069557.1 helix-turn-helix domain-containing protein [Mycolicibacter sp. MYC017]